MYTESNQTYKKKLEKKLIQMELGFSKDGKLDTFKYSDKFHVQIFAIKNIHTIFLSLRSRGWTKTWQI